MWFVLCSDIIMHLLFYDIKKWLVSEFSVCVLAGLPLT